MKLSVVIVNYKVKYYLAQCIHSVLKAMDGIEGEIIVVDNDSKDDSVEFIRQLYPQVTIIKNRKNLGFSRANNIAITQSHGEYILILNPDTIINENILKECTALLDSNPQIGATGVRMLNPDGTFAPESRRGIPTPFTAFCKMSGLNDAFPTNRTFGRYYMKFLDENSATPIEIISGAYMFVRKSVLDKCGLFDEDFFMFGEDIDLSYRMLKTGYKNYYLPSRIIHYKGESSRKNTFRYVYVFYKAMYIFFKKHYSTYNWLLSIPIRSAIYIKGATEYLTRKTRGMFVKRRGVLSCMRKSRFLLKGSNKSLESMIAICDKYGLLCETEEKPTFIPDYIVYDTDTYSYSEIISDLEQRANGGNPENTNGWSIESGNTGSINRGNNVNSRRNGNDENSESIKVNLATYSSKLGCIITAQYVFKQ